MTHRTFIFNETPISSLSLDVDYQRCGINCRKSSRAEQQCCVRHNIHFSTINVHPIWYSSMSGDNILHTLVVMQWALCGISWCMHVQRLYGCEWLREWKRNAKFMQFLSFLFVLNVWRTARISLRRRTGNVFGLFIEIWIVDVTLGVHNFNHTTTLLCHTDSVSCVYNYVAICRVLHVHKNVIDRFAQCRWQLMPMKKHKNNHNHRHRHQDRFDRVVLCALCKFLPILSVRLNDA